MSLKFTLDCDINNTHFRSYYTINEETDKLYKLLNDEKFNEKYFPYGSQISDFNETVAKLNRIGNDNNINIFDNQYSDGYKESFSLTGLYKEEVFTLYDYKADQCIHIGGNDNLDIKNLISELNELLKNTNPLEYTAKYHYDNSDGIEYSYKVNL